MMIIYSFENSQGKLVGHSQKDTDNFYCNTRKLIRRFIIIQESFFYFSEGRSSRNGSTYQLSSGSLSRECSVLESGRSQSISMPPQSKPAPQPTSISNKPEKSVDDLLKIVNMFIEEYIAEGNKEVSFLKHLLILFKFIIARSLDPSLIFQGDA